MSVSQSISHLLCLGIVTMMSDEKMLFENNELYFTTILTPQLSIFKEFWGTYICGNYMN